MAEYSLTEKQKDMLRSIVPSLEDETLNKEWIYGDDRGEIKFIKGLNPQLWEMNWQGVTKADFDDFVDCGFFRQKSEKTYTINAQKIIDAVHDNFGEETERDQAEAKSLAERMKRFVDSRVEIGVQSIKPDDPAKILMNPVFGLPSPSSQFQCDVFMVMPFADEFTSIYRDYIKSIVENLNLTIKRGDDFFSHHDIVHEIWSAIFASRLVIADCTNRNANVFYELGVAHTLGKPTILITQDIKDVPFDVQGKRFIEYKNNAAGLKHLQNQLQDFIIKAIDKDV